MARSRFTPSLPAPREVPWTPAQGVGVVIAAHATLILGGTIAIAAFGYGSTTDAKNIPIGIQVAATAPFWVAAIALTWILVRRTGGDARRDLGLGWHWSDVPIGVALGVGTQYLVLPVVYWPIFQVLDKDADELGQAARDLAETASGVGGGTVLFFLMAAVFAPVAEEVMYRGALLRGVERRGWPIAILGSSLVFAALHFQPLQFVGLFIIGVVCALGAAWSGRLSLAIVTHVAFNAATAIPLILDL